MARPKLEIPTPAEFRALIFLHQHGPATVKEYHEKSGLRNEGRAYTSVMSQMNILHKKGFATRKEAGRTFRYAAVFSLANLRTRALQQVLETAFGGSLDEMKAAVAKLDAPSKRKK